jgi:hypothetical protein
MYTKLWMENMKGRDYFGRPSRRWEDNIKINNKETEYEDVD